MARRVMSPRFPIGVGTKATCGEFLESIGDARDNGLSGALEGVGESIGPGGLQVVVDEETGASAIGTFFERFPRTFWVDELPANFHFEVEFLRAESVPSVRACLAVCDFL